jgi:hypothetical protein
MTKKRSVTKVLNEDTNLTSGWVDGILMREREKQTFSKLPTKPKIEQKLRTKSMLLREGGDAERFYDGELI